MSRDPALLAECQALVRELRRRSTIAALRSAPDWPELDRRLRAVLSTVRRHAPGREPDAPADVTRVRAVHWNIEHGNRYPQVEVALRTHPQLAGADLLTLNEVDLGMARAANRDVAADLATALGLHAAWAPLFFETTPGRHDDASTSAGRENQESLFGLAILSRWPIGETRIVELPGPEEYEFDVEGMYGRHIALVADIERPGAPFVAITAHLEVHRTREHRAAQMRVLLEALRGETRPLVLGGDLNSSTFDRGRWRDAPAGALVLAAWPGGLLRRRLLWPDRGRAREPLFDALREAAFEWERFADRQPSLHLRFVRLPEARGPLASPLARPILRWAERRAHLRLDWFAARGWRAGRGATVRGLDGP
ncbi:MAG: endonuclease/exonuclease/phosphatase family protein, partial [Candidatus Eisenbacteria bacterium]